MSRPPTRLCQRIANRLGAGANHAAGQGQHDRDHPVARRDRLRLPRAVLRPLGLSARRGAGVSGGCGRARAVPRRGGGRVVLLTNSPRPAGDVTRQLDGLGAPRSCWDVVVSSGDAAQAAMVAGQFGRRVYHIGPERDLGFFQDAEGRPFDIERVPLEEAEGIVCTGLFDDHSETPRRLPRDDPLRQDQGAEAALRQPRHRGRRRRDPHLLRWRDRPGLRRGRRAQLLLRQAASADLHARPPAHRGGDRGSSRRRDEILCLGDGIATDVLGASGEGLDALFISGGLAAEETATTPAAGRTPLPCLFSKKHGSPDLTMSYLR